MDYKTMDEAWEAFHESCIASDAPEIVKISIKRSFYLGAGAMLKMILLIGLDKKDSKEFADFCKDFLYEIISGI